MVEYQLAWPKSKEETYVARLTPTGWLSCKTLLDQGELFTEVVVAVTFLLRGCSLSLKKAPVEKVLADLDKKGVVFTHKGFYVKKNRAVRERGEDKWLS